MKKIISIFIIGLFIASGFAAFSATSDEADAETKYFHIQMKPLSINQIDQYTSIQTDSATSYLMIPGEPTLPVVTKTFVLPFNSQFKDLEVILSEEQSITVDSLIQPAPKAVIDGSNENGIMPPSQAIYQSSEAYPKEDYTFSIKVGLYNKEPAMFVNVHCYPIKYIPSENQILVSHEIDIDLTYKNPEHEVTMLNEYDLLIIAPNEFRTGLEPLVEHKNSVDMNTKLVTLEEIYDGDTIGRSNKESIKLYIKQARETWGITYVMLVGGHIGQSLEWHLPVLYADTADETFISDLYYMDLYKYENNETVFEDWDSDGDDDLAEWGFWGDDIDGAPDVYVGRLACRDTEQVDVMVNKIIAYESSKADDSWFKKMLLIGGDTYPESPIAFEAEIDTNLSASYMTGFTFERLWASTGALTGQEDVEAAMNEGCGFIHMAGHANPSTLVTHPPFDKKKENPITILTMYDVFNLDKFNPDLQNGEMQPVIVIGGCHNSQFNTSLAVILEEIKEYGFRGTFMGPPWRFYYKEWVPKCFSWWLTSKEDGGAIATFGNTGLGMGIWDYGYLEGLDGWLFPRFFYHYGQEGKEHIGWAQGAAITDYVNEFDINKDSQDRQMVQQWALLGDPSLMPGGYSN